MFNKLNFNIQYKIEILVETLNFYFPVYLEHYFMYMHLIRLKELKKIQSILVEKIPFIGRNSLFIIY